MVVIPSLNNKNKNKVSGFNTEVHCGVVHYHRTYLLSTLSDVINSVFKESIEISKIVKITIRPINVKII